MKRNNKGQFSLVQHVRAEISLPRFGPSSNGHIAPGNLHTDHSIPKTDSKRGTDHLPGVRQEEQL